MPDTSQFTTRRQIARAYLHEREQQTQRTLELLPIIAPTGVETTVEAEAQRMRNVLLGLPPAQIISTLSSDLELAVLAFLTEPKLPQAPKLEGTPDANQP